MPRNLGAGGALLALSILGAPGALRGQARAAALLAWSPSPVAPTSGPALPRPAAPAARPIRWYHGLAAVGAVAVISLGDQGIQDQAQSHRTPGGDDLARTARRLGEFPIYALPALGTLAVGTVVGDGRVVRAGGRMTAGLFTAALATNLLKPVVGRKRPATTTDAFLFKPFSGRDAWPSGHTTMAFALAAGLGDEIGSLPVSVALYGAATLTAWSRVNDNRHWASDVAAGALVGIASAKLMNGRWRVFGLSAPRFLLEPGAVGVRAAF
ncbi:MAG: phosphatase PAP2 family protein [Gemmatimonadales bacterium]|nr:phosphatase PAP2 family protein [Gemmatimonadales bacterium]